MRDELEPRAIKAPPLPRFWRIAPFAVLAIIASAAFGSTWMHDHDRAAGVELAEAKAARLDDYCSLIHGTVRSMAQPDTEIRRGDRVYHVEVMGQPTTIDIWNDLVMYDARALTPCLRAGGERVVTGCPAADYTGGDADRRAYACVVINAQAALAWFAETPRWPR